MDDATTTADPFYDVDGFHGGVDGHFPLGTLRDILAGLDAHPHWKVSLEIEPYTWAVVQLNDPATIARLRHLLADRSPATRVELVSAAYAEPYLWTATGESVVRQLRYGRAAIAAVLPEAVVDTYAVQEPCWTSCRPQLLRSFGFKRAALPNSTCWGGYHAGQIDADLCHWVGPDGSAITTAPRYGVDALVGPATEQNATLPGDYPAKCHAARIAHPADVAGAAPARHLAGVRRHDRRAAGAAVGGDPGGPVGRPRLGLDGRPADRPGVPGRRAIRGPCSRHSKWVARAPSQTAPVWTVRPRHSAPRTDLRGFWQKSPHG